MTMALILVDIFHDEHNGWVATNNLNDSVTYFGQYIYTMSIMTNQNLSLSDSVIE